MIRTKHLTVALLLAFASPWCYAQQVDPPSRAVTEAVNHSFLDTSPLADPTSSPNFDAAETNHFGAMGSRTRATESLLVLPETAGTGFLTTDTLPAKDNVPTGSLNDRQPHPTGHATTVTNTDVEPDSLQAAFNRRLSEAEQREIDFSDIDPVNFQVDDFNMPLDTPVMQSSAAYSDSGVNSVAQFNVGVDLYAAPNFKNGLLIYGKNVAMKIGGYVKADFIYDFDPIDSTDSFDTTKIPVDALPRTNSRFHARQSRLSFDTRWKGGGEVVKIYVEGDFFSTSDTFRLRQAYGESGRLLVGKSWTAFTDVAAAPATLDFEGSVSSVNRRQAQARYTFPICDDIVTGTLSLEDTRFIIDLDPSFGTSRSPSPDFVGHVRLATDLIQLQAAALYREVGFQPTDKSTITRSAGGMNFTGVFMLTGRTKAYSQVLFGKGIGSYRSLPDAAAVTGGQAVLLPMFGWMFGLTHEWTDLLSSNFTYASNEIENTSGQEPDAVKENTYMAINLLAKPQNRITVGIEYLYGTRTDKDLQSAGAHRVQCAVIFDLP